MGGVEQLVDEHDIEKVASANQLSADDVAAGELSLDCNRFLIGRSMINDRVSDHEEGITWLRSAPRLLWVARERRAEADAAERQRRQEKPNTKQYMVHLSSVPSVLSYQGGVNGLRATATVDDEDDEYEDEEDVDDLDYENLVDGDAIGDGNGGMGGSGVNATAPGSAPEAEAGAAAAVAESEVKLTTSESGDDGFDADIHFASAAAAEAAMEMAGVVTGAGAAAGKEGIAGVAATAVAGGRGVGGGSRGGAVRVSALPFGRTGVDALVERVGQRLRRMKSRSVGRRLLARVAAAAVAAAAEEAAEESTGAAAGAAAGAASVTESFQNSSLYPSAVSTTTVNAIHSTSAAVLTVQQLSARAARIMRSTPWGRLMRPDVRLPHVQAFTRFLEASHRSLLQSLKIPSSAIFHSYTYLMNSFAAQLTASEARRLKLHPAVAEVERDRSVEVASVHSPEFLKLDSSLWPANGGQSNAGEGVIIGVIDSGIWPEHPSFSDHDTSGVSYSTAPVRWRGVCSTTDDFTACSRKVVGARYFLKGAERAFGQVNTIVNYRSPRDMLQHGTWCAGAAAGNAGVEVTVGGRTFGTASGMAPRARLAVYKALWMYGHWNTVKGQGATSDLIAAAEKAVADGVDVISCSWGGLALYFQDLPYLRGLKAGVVTAFAAGNAGWPNLLYGAGVVTAFAAGNKGRPKRMNMLGTLSNASPFYLTVGASTMGREYTAVPTLGDGTTFLSTFPFPLTAYQCSPSAPWGGRGSTRGTMGREYTAVLTLGDGTTFTGRRFGGTAALWYNVCAHLQRAHTMGRDHTAVLTLGNGNTLTGRSCVGTAVMASPLPLNPPFLPPQHHGAGVQSGAHPGQWNHLPLHLPIHPHRPPLLPTPPHRSTMGRDCTVVLTLGDGTTFTGRSFGSTAATVSPLPPQTPPLPSHPPLLPPQHHGAGVQSCAHPGRWNHFSLHLPIQPHHPPPLPTAPHCSTMGRDYTAVLTLGNGTTFTGRSLGGNSATATPLPLMLAGDYTTVGLPDDAYQCYRGYVDVTRVAGKFLVCSLFDRTLSGIVADVDRMGAAAVLVLNATVPRETQYSIPFSRTPIIFLEERHLWTIEDYIRAASSPIATLSAFTASYSSNAPQVAYFSSTGPPRSPLYLPALLIRDYPTNDILKPDVVGPGFQLWAAGVGKSAATAATDPPEFGYKSGTSIDGRGETKGDLQAFRGRRESAEVGDGRGERKGDDCMLGDLRLHNVITAVIPGGCTPPLQSRI
ncbi:unnamed protein product [Closterium sp. NIES-64]|nr:unnamed protein product [Closterium sp. NIES-64]